MWDHCVATIKSFALHDKTQAADSTQAQRR